MHTRRFGSYDPRGPAQYDDDEVRHWSAKLKRRPRPYIWWTALRCLIREVVLTVTMLCLLLLTGTLFYYAGLDTFQLVVNKSGSTADVLVVLVSAVVFGVGILWSVASALTATRRPRGLLLDESELPDLSSLVERIRKEQAVMPLRGIILDDSCGIHVVTQNRFGLLPPHERYLTIGLPLLAVLDKDEIEALMVRAFAYRSSRLGVAALFSLAHWASWRQLIYDDTITLGPVFDASLKRLFAADLLRSLNVKCIALARQRCIAADRATVRSVDQDVFASALMRVELARIEVERSTSSSVGSAIESIRTAELASSTESIKTVLARPTDGFVAAPTLSDRLQAFEVGFTSLQKASPDSIELLGGHEQQWVERLERALLDSSRLSRRPPVARGPTSG